MSQTTDWRPRDWISIDAEYAWSHARFTGGRGGEEEIPNAIEHMASGGIHWGRETGIYGSLRGRFFTGYPLEESGTYHADDSFFVNARIGYRWDHWDLAVDVLNVFDRDDNDIEYFYESRLPGGHRRRPSASRRTETIPGVTHLPLVMTDDG